MDTTAYNVTITLDRVTLIVTVDAEDEELAETAGFELIMQELGLDLSSTRCQIDVEEV